MADAVVIGAGPNGLVAANVLADAGWTVEVLEEQAEPGGAVRSDHGVESDFVNDLFSSFYPLAAASPAWRRCAWRTRACAGATPRGSSPTPCRTAAAPYWTGTRR